jgi:hypothetical protein
VSDPRSGVDGDAGPPFCSLNLDRRTSISGLRLVDFDRLISISGSQRWSTIGRFDRCIPIDNFRSADADPGEGGCA